MAGLFPANQFLALTHIGGNPFGIAADTCMTSICYCFLMFFNRQ